MLQHKRNLVLDICDYNRNKVCPLYDSTSDIQGQAANIVKETQRNGWKELSFTIPSKCEGENGILEDNYRLDYLKADYLIRFEDDEETDWFIIQEPKITHKNFSKDVSVSADHVSRLLKTKNLGLEFSDEEGNNVGTARELLTTILDGTGWEPGYVEEFKEKRTSDKVKVRSLKAAAKTGAFKLIASMCDLFEAKPIYHGDTKTVDIVPMNPFQEPIGGELPEIEYGKAIELHYGKNMKNISRTLNTENLVTKLYCYGAYGDKTSGYCGIDEWDHTEFKYDGVQLTAGTEYRIIEEDPIANITYTRYFTSSKSGTFNLVWSLLDPASMSYVWAVDPNDEEDEGTAFRIYEERKTDNFVPLTKTSEETVTNYFSFLMDFDYYSNVGLLTDEMLQVIGEYQRKMPALLKATNEAAAAFNQSLDKVQETVGYEPFCKLSVTGYENNGGYLKLNLNLEDYPNKGIIYRTDYNVKEKKQFKWRVANQLKENGDPVQTVASVLYIIHKQYDPVRFDKVYLRGINNHTGDDVDENDIDNPENITLWLNYNKADVSDYSQDEFYLFRANTINGLLGAMESSDEAIVETLENQTTNVSVKHPVYFVRNPKDGSNPLPSTNDFTGYAWAWLYDDTVDGSENLLYFCFKDEGDNKWERVIFTEDSLPESGFTERQYCYRWRKSMLYRYAEGEWRALDESTRENRVVSLFGTVWSACQRRDQVYKGYYDYYTLMIDENITSVFGENHTLPVGNYAIKETNEQWTVYYGFTTDKPLVAGQDKITYSTTNGWIVELDKDEHYSDSDIEQYVERTIRCESARFDSVFSHKSNILDDATWSEGTIDPGTGTLKPGSSIFYDGGGEEDSTTMKRTGFINIYPNIPYEIYNANGQVTLHFYAIEHGYLGNTTVNVTTEGRAIYYSPANARFVRMVTSNGTVVSSMISHAKNYNSSYVYDEQTYYILGVASTNLDEPNRLRGIISLVDNFNQYSDQAYITDYNNLKDAQDNMKELENTMVNTLGDIYREGYWQKADYVDGDEEKLYYDGLENLEKIAWPESKYDIQFLDLYKANLPDMYYAADEYANITSWPDVTADYGVHIVDPEIGLSKWGFIDKLNKCYDQPWKTTISVNTDLSTIAQHSFTDVMTHIADVAKETHGKMEMYDRTSAFSSDGSLATSNLEGVIDANRLILTGGSSTWYTDDKGNMVFESSDGKSAMTLTGNGFSIANNKDASGEWIWRTFGTGNGFTADLITAGTVDAQRVITNQLMSYMNENLVLSSNNSIIFVVGEAKNDIIDIINSVEENTNQKINDKVGKTEYDNTVLKINNDISTIQMSSVTHDELTNELVARNYATVNMTDSMIRASVGELQSDIQTNMELKPDGLYIRQGNDSKYEMKMTSDEMSFILKSDPSKKAALFGVNGAEVDRVRSNKELSVGTADNGWYDFIMVKNGLAEKWRTTSSVTLPAQILSQPSNGSGQTSVTFSVSGIGDNYQWSRSPDGVQWTDIANATLSTYTVSFANSGVDLLYAYKCTLTGGGQSVDSDVVYAFCQTGPKVIAYVNGTSLVAKTFSQNTVSTQWYQKNGNSWSAISGSTGSAGNTYICLVSDGNGYNASEIVTM